MFDRFTLSLLGAVLLATLLPAQGTVAQVCDWATVIGVAILFFLHGARLSREAVVAGLAHWRLHLTVLGCTFLLFPLLGLALKPLVGLFLAPALVTGLLYLCTLPSTVQSSIAFTSIARGNVPAAVCSASASNLLGIFITPLLVGLLLSTQGHMGSPLSAIGNIVLQLLIPFLAGHLLRPWIGDFIARWKSVLTLFDRGTILLVVYSAFSEAVVGGLWRQLSASMLLALLGVCIGLLMLVLALTQLLARRLGFAREDRITLLFCGSKKSLATGVPMANILFGGSPALGMIVLPLMLFHQVQLMACAWLANRYARQAQGIEQA
ncbi:bile acid:sodium symporter family protein [Pseudoxanthomonas composti]|uniref:Bile acid:sodium symporter n=1 Tax=Pseudoxanthomonas composti TaxID=2137479 RepID=A0A4Q1JZV1_9GAMM|nr:bile acid:sodium symporter family protein [Pseudoxanthomonas composti]RXR08844.1 bile acid:sodium symporter [Pseudoxanthomonas composti]